MAIEREVATLKRMTVDQLRARYSEAFGEPTNARHKEWLIKRIAWRLQALAEGDLSDRARQRAAELARDADLRLSPPTAAAVAEPAVVNRDGRDRRLPAAGTVLTRIYKGSRLEVLVGEDGFEFEGESFKSLSAVAKKITGSHCNGFLFFGLTDHGGAR